jgi:hypothetical protein
MDGHVYVKPFMLQRIVIKIAQLDGVMSKGIHPKFVLLSGVKELSYSEVGYLPWGGNGPKMKGGRSI